MLLVALVGLSLSILLLTTLALHRLSTILSPSRPRPTPSKDARKHILIVLGSGGHTAEMIAMLSRASDSSTTSPEQAIDWTKLPRRTWVVSSGDSISASRARAFEEEVISPSSTDSSSYTLRTVPRARKIHQSLLSAPFSSLVCLRECVEVLLGAESARRSEDQVDGIPDLILCNGPATATILVLASVLLRFFDVRGCHTKGKMRTVYVESWARVKKLSLSGWLLQGVVDRFLVQWPELGGDKEKGRMGGGRGREFVGVLV